MKFAQKLCASMQIVWLSFINRSQVAEYFASQYTLGSVLDEIEETIYQEATIYHTPECDMILYFVVKS